VSDIVLSFNLKITIEVVVNGYGRGATGKGKEVSTDDATTT
jgi:hypothetical protein